MLSVIMVTDNDCAKPMCGLLDSISYGEALALLATFAMAGYNVLNRFAAQIEIDPLAITTFSAIFGAIIFRYYIFILW